MNLFKNQKGFNDVILVAIVGGIIGALFIAGVFVWQEIDGQKDFNNLITKITQKTIIDNKQVDAHMTKGHVSDQVDAIKVTLVHDKSQETSLNDDFVMTDDTHILASIYYAPVADGLSEEVLVKDFVDIDQLPFLFQIKGDLDQVFENDRGYYLSVKVFNHSGDDIVVGDLMSEWSTPISKEDRNIEIKASGQEECGSENSGGFCTSTTKSESIDVDGMTYFGYGYYTNQEKVYYEYWSGGPKVTIDDLPKYFDIEHKELFEISGVAEVSGADPETFEAVYQICHMGYCTGVGKDKNGVYNGHNDGYGRFKDADPETFEYLDYVYYKDKNTLYYFGSGGVGRADFVDTDTFEIINPVYTRDKNNIYSFMDTFMIDKDGLYVADGSVYYRKSDGTDIVVAEAIKDEEVIENNITYWQAELSPSNEFILLYSKGWEFIIEEVYEISSGVTYKLEASSSRGGEWLEDNRIRIEAECGMGIACGIYESKNSEEPWDLERISDYK